MLEEESRELQACQPDLSAKECRRADRFEFRRTPRAGQPGNQAQPARVWERQVLLD